jgi:hypothetical protein
MNLVWVHEDAISLDHPAALAAGPSARAIFIWDTEEHDRRGYTLKRRVFIYECALDLDIPIYVGDAFEVLSSLSEGHTKIYAAASVDPYILGVLKDLRDEHQIEVVDAPRLANVPANTDTGRFFRFWNRARKSALTHSRDSLTAESLPNDGPEKNSLVS